MPSIERTRGVFGLALSLRRRKSEPLPLSNERRHGLALLRISRRALEALCDVPTAARRRLHVTQQEAFARGGARRRLRRAGDVLSELEGRAPRRRAKSKPAVAHQTANANSLSKP